MGNQDLRIHTVSQCLIIPKGIANVKPKPIVDIASRLRFLLEDYTSEDERHIDYTPSIRGSEEFARYSIDFGKNEVEVLRYVSQYLDSSVNH